MKPFNDKPYAYHAEIELEIHTLTNLGAGLGRVDNWVVMVAFALPGERVRARVFRNHKNFSEADLVAILKPSPRRIEPVCPLFGRCGGCQYQNLDYAEQLAWKRRQVEELLRHMAGIEFPVAPVIASPRQYGYRSKITPHFNAPKGAERPVFSSQFSVFSPQSGDSPPPPADTVSSPTENRKLKTENSVAAQPPRIGFLRQGTRFDIVDVPRCEIATAPINERLAAVRDDIRRRAAAGDYTRGATLLLRDAGGEVTTDYDRVITERAGDITLHFLARDFFQNNPFILPAFTGYVREQAAASGARFLVDAYCGSGLFALTAARAFERVAGVEISESSVNFARENAAANDIANATFKTGDAAAIFAGLGHAPGPAFAPKETVIVIDPPRKGCDENFLAQLFAFAPKSVVYVSCDPATQMRDLKHFTARGYKLTAVQPFDLFPQTRHLECVVTLIAPDLTPKP